MTSFRDISIKWKQTLITIFVTAVSLSLIAIVMIFEHRKTTRDFLLHDLSMMAEIIATNTTAALTFNDPETAKEVLLSLKGKLNVIGAVIYTKDRHLFTYYPDNFVLRLPNRFLEHSPGYRFEKKQVILWKDIWLESKKIGTVVLFYDLKEIRSQLKQYIWFVSLVLMGATFAAFLLSFLLLPLVFRPIRNLLRSINEVSAKKDYSIRVTHKGQDELGKLVQGFNEMLSQIQSRDISLQKANRELYRLSEVKSQFTSMVSHELRTPLAAIKEGIGIVMDGIDGPVTLQQQETLKIAKDSVDRLARFINNVLDFAKLESGKMEMLFEKTKMNELIHETFTLMSLSAKEKGIAFEEVLPEKEVIVVCDSDKIKQVVINLVNNAIKYTPSGGNIYVRLKQESHQIRIEVEDTGIGIPEGEQERIFEMFSRVHLPRNYLAKGSGIGLAICKLIAIEHQGTISVQSTLGNGSCFIVTFPKLLPLWQG